MLFILNVHGKNARVMDITEILREYIRTALESYLSHESAINKADDFISKIHFYDCNRCVIMHPGGDIIDVILEKGSFKVRLHVMSIEELILCMLTIPSELKNVEVISSAIEKLVYDIKNQNAKNTHTNHPIMEVYKDGRITQIFDEKERYPEIISILSEYVSENVARYLYEDLISKLTGEAFAKFFNPSVPRLQADLSYRDGSIIINYGEVKKALIREVISPSFELIKELINEVVQRIYAYINFGIKNKNLAFVEHFISLEPDYVHVAIEYEGRSMEWISRKEEFRFVPVPGQKNRLTKKNINIETMVDVGNVPAVLRYKAVNGEVRRAEITLPNYDIE